MTRKLLSGGSWIYFPRYCRSATRNHFGPGITSINDGFRVVCNEPERSSPTDKVIRGEHKLFLGGSWGFLPGDCRSATRYHGGPGISSYYVGFRVVCNELERSTPPAKTLSGGSWFSLPSVCGSAYRDRFRLNDADIIYGFRVVCNDWEAGS